MSNFYIKGMSSDSGEINKILTKLSDNGIETLNVVDDYSKYMMYKKKDILDIIVEEINKNNVTNSPINLICHSMGCNFGILIPKKLSSINKIVMISPEFKEVSEIEKNEIQNKSISYSREANVEAINYKKLKSIILFLKSKKWANNEIEDYLRLNISTLFVYSKGDQFVFQEFIHKLSKNDNVSECGIDSGYHNPILDNSVELTEIKQFIR